MTTTLNIAYNWNEPDSEGSLLSNFHPRNFIFEGRKYSSVEQAYQSLKYGKFDESVYSQYEDMFNSGSPLRKIRGNGEYNELYCIELIGKLVEESLKQNEEVWAILGKYDNFTHDVYNIYSRKSCISSLVDLAFLNMIHFMSRKWKERELNV